LAAVDIAIFREIAGAAGGKKLSKRVFLHLKFGGDAPLELIRWSLAERFGWRLEDVDALKWSELVEFFQIEDGRSRVR
jgi:hypothetical protein